MTSHPSALRDFTVDRRVLLLSAVAIVIGACGAFLALLLLRSIALATNLFYFGRLSAANVSPSGTPFGLYAVLVPVLGGLLVGLIARYGSDKIRGHGIPEAIEAILLRGARVQPRLAILKPLSAAISIGSGGPFGAEGPIIMTGGAFGSLIAQFMHLSAAERTTLMVAGAAAGMSATFATPLAAVLLAVELLLFEWRPRSLVPVALASVTAALLRVKLLGAGPLFPMPAFPAGTQLSDLSHLIGVALLLGLVVGFCAAWLSRMVYGSEDLFARLPMHNMWWPAIGGLGVGIGGLFFPEALGVGYDNIARLVAGHPSAALIAGVLVVKSLIWSFSLGSGTSGGVLAPLLMIGGSLGALVGYLFHLPVSVAALYSLIGMGAMLSGSLGVPLTATVFCVELTGELTALLPLIVACACAHMVTSLIMPRSILTERLSRRGFHLSREYGVDPLETVSVLDAMAALHEGETLSANGPVAYSDDTCRTASETMALAGVKLLPVVDRATGTVVGAVHSFDLLLGRRRFLEREATRERVLSPALLRR